MLYVISAIVFGFLGSLVQVSAGAEMFSGLWWSIGMPFWLLGGLVGGVLSNA